MLRKLEDFYSWIDSHLFLRWCWDAFSVLVFSALGAELAIILIS